MLKRLSIRDIVLIEKLDLDFSGGLSVLTGETGAGKSILLDALGLALGARGDAGLVRAGAERGSVSVALDATGNRQINALLEEAGIERNDELVVRRLQNANGTSRALINDQPVSVSFLKRLGAVLCEIHGQHEARALVDVKAHRALLDAFGKLEGQVGGVTQAYAELSATRAQLDQHRERLAKSGAEQAFLQHSLVELEDMAAQKGEEDKLADTRQLMMNAEGLSALVASALAALDGDGTTLAKLNAVLRKLEMKRDQAGGRLDELCQALERVVVEMNEASAVAQGCVSAFAYDGDVLEKAEQRLFALRALARKHKITVDELPDLLARMKKDLAAIESGEEELQRLEKRCEEALQVYLAKARELSAARHESAGELDRAVKLELAPLRLENARFETRIVTDESQPSANGIDRVEFMVSANPGLPVAPMIKVASGGELSRFMLALKVVLASAMSAPTLVFDEIDTGVGGAVADAIGKRLARLADDLQVLTITHSPQVASRADAHMLISKIAGVGEGNERAVTRVVELHDKGRREEIARMLSGASITPQARAQAEQLMAGSGNG